MNAIEEKLQTAIGSEYTLYKYHDTEDYTDDVPDIYSYLYDWRDVYLDEIDRLKIARYKNPDDERVIKHLSFAEDMLKSIECSIDGMHMSEDIYYVLPSSKSYYETPLIINTVYHDLAIPQISEDNVVTFKKTGDKLLCYLLPKYVDGKLSYRLLPETFKFNDKSIALHDRYGTFMHDIYYIYDHVKHYNETKHIICYKCKEPCDITKKEKWCISNGPGLSSFCKDCVHMNI